MIAYVAHTAFIIILVFCSAQVTDAYNSGDLRRLIAADKRFTDTSTRRIRNRISKRGCRYCNSIHCNDKDESAKSSGSGWNSVGLSQQQLMDADKCFHVDFDDNVLSYVSKGDAHSFTLSNPQGHLHRAFSIFLFREDGKLLLQRRALDKITFPGVWSNTCCSHPISGCIPSELDSPEAVKVGDVTGIKHAARRKLHHELGISIGDISIPNMKYLTRIHYCSADVLSGNQESARRQKDFAWGEHEIDYMLFLRVPSSIPLNINEEEVCDIRWVDLSELSDMMQAKTGLTWSPWFSIIVEKHLKYWWSDLEETFNTNKFVEYDQIYRYL